MANTYYAQAREYLPTDGRFMAEDIIKGNVAVPFALNHYGYCWNNPIHLVDFDGLLPDESENAVNFGEYVAAVYVLSEGRTPFSAPYGVLETGGAFGQGHAGLLLVKNNGMSEFYSNAGKVEIGAVGWSGSEGYLSTHVDANGNPQDIVTEDFFRYGGAYTDSVNSKKVNSSTIDPYTHAVYIPITNSEGVRMRLPLGEMVLETIRNSIWRSSKVCERIYKFEDSCVTTIERAYRK